MSPSVASEMAVPAPAGDAVTVAGVMSGSAVVSAPQISSSANVRKLMAGVVLETRWMRMVSAVMPRRAEVPHARELLLSVAVDGRKI